MVNFIVTFLASNARGIIFETIKMVIGLEWIIFFFWLLLWSMTFQDNVNASKVNLTFLLNISMILTFHQTPQYCKKRKLKFMKLWPFASPISLSTVHISTPWSRTCFSLSLESLNWIYHASACSQRMTHWDTNCFIFYFSLNISSVYSMPWK